MPFPFESLAVEEEEEEALVEEEEAPPRRLNEDVGRLKNPRVAGAVRWRVTRESIIARLSDEVTSGVGLPK